MTHKEQFLLRLNTTVLWIQDAISRKVIGSKEDRIAFREVAGMLAHLGRLERRLKYGSVRPRKRP